MTERERELESSVLLLQLDDDDDDDVCVSMCVLGSVLPQSHEKRKKKENTISAYFYNIIILRINDELLNM